jgi:hypothetical protein
MTTKLKTRKPAAADLKKMATLDFEPWKENPAEALLWFNFALMSGYVSNKFNWLYGDASSLSSSTS